MLTAKSQEAGLAIKYVMRRMTIGAINSCPEGSALNCSRHKKTTKKILKKKERAKPSLSFNTEKSIMLLYD
jgi:hypothetical protein